jgi:hypothetical protein
MDLPEPPRPDQRAYPPAPEAPAPPGPGSKSKPSTGFIIAMIIVRTDRPRRDHQRFRRRVLIPGRRRTVFLGRRHLRRLRRFEPGRRDLPEPKRGTRLRNRRSRCLGSPASPRHPERSSTSSRNEATHRATSPVPSRSTARWLKGIRAAVRTPSARRAAVSDRSGGWHLVDIARYLGVSKQRAHQLAAEGRSRRP